MLWSRLFEDRVCESNQEFVFDWSKCFVYNWYTSLPANYIGSTKNQRRQVDSMLILCLFNGLCRVGSVWNPSDMQADVALILKNWLCQSSVKNVSKWLVYSENRVSLSSQIHISSSAAIDWASDICTRDQGKVVPKDKHRIQCCNCL